MGRSASGFAKLLVPRLQKLVHRRRRPIKVKEADRIGEPPLCRETEGLPSYNLTKHEPNVASQRLTKSRELQFLQRPRIVGLYWAAVQSRCSLMLEMGW